MADTLLLVGFVVFLYAIWVVEVGRHLGRVSARYPTPAEDYRDARLAKAAARARAHESLARRNCAPSASIDVSPRDRP